MVPDVNKRGEPVGVVMANPLFSFSKELAATQNALSGPVCRKILAVGLGALGSQIFINLVRAGYGEWMLIDKDCLLPHNLARHSLPGNAVGFGKANALAVIANEMVEGEPIAKFIHADILYPSGNVAEQIKDACRGTDVLIDMSASVAVSRHMSIDVDSTARRLSLFLSPTGMDLVLMVEDSERKNPLDHLEMTYYRHLASNVDFFDHLAAPAGRRRYGNSCRDISSSIPQYRVALHAAIGANAVKTVLESAEAQIIVWRTFSEIGNVRSHRLQTEPMVEAQVGDWRIRTDGWILGRIFGARSMRLPNETGGILIGCSDLLRKILYVVDTELSPPDSMEWPTCYIRGCRGLAARVTKIQEATGGGLEYVGEWHSHPDGHSCGLSREDQRALAYLREIMQVEGRPALMLIASDDSFAFHLDGIE